MGVERMHRFGKLLGVSLAVLVVSISAIGAAALGVNVQSRTGEAVAPVAPENIVYVCDNGGTVIGVAFERTTFVNTADTVADYPRETIFIRSDAVSSTFAYALTSLSKEASSHICSVT